MLVALGDLKKENCSFSFDAGGRLRLIFPDHSVILDSKEGVSVCDAGKKPRASEAERWLERHCPGD